MLQFDNNSALHVERQNWETFFCIVLTLLACLERKQQCMIQCKAIIDITMEIIIVGLCISGHLISCKCEGRSDLIDCESGSNLISSQCKVRDDLIDDCEWIDWL